MESQIKTEINQLIMKLSDKQLIPILQYLKELENATIEQIDVSNNLKKILEEDAILLKRLAQ